MKEFQTLSEIIKNRRSVFPNQYSEEKISDDLINQILENANWAPNHKNTEPWRFHVFSRASLTKLSQYMGDEYRKNTPADKYSERKHKKRIQNPLKSSHVIAICMQRDPLEKIPEWEELAAVSCAVMNMWLSCSSLGFGAYWSTPEAALEANEFLGLPDSQKCIGFFYIGKKNASIEILSNRNPIKEKVTWH